MNLLQFCTVFNALDHILNYYDYTSIFFSGKPALYLATLDVLLHSDDQIRLPDTEVEMMIKTS